MLGYSIGLRALLASQRSIDVVGQNLANFATEGYSRQRIELLSAAPFLRVGVGAFGTGVTTGDVERVHDELLEARLRTQHRILAGVSEEASWLRVVEGALQEPATPDSPKRCARCSPTCPS